MPPGCACLLAVLLLGVSAEEASEDRTGTFHEMRAALAHLAGEGRTYLGRLAEEQTVVSVQKALSRVVGVLAGGLAAGLTVLLQQTSVLLEAAGLRGSLRTTPVTPEGVVFVGQWLLAAAAAYWLGSALLRLLTSALRRTLWLLKVALAAVCFACILSDHRAGAETLAARLGVLVCVCVLLGLGGPGGAGPADKTARLEQQVKILQKRLTDLEKWTRAED